MNWEQALRQRLLEDADVAALVGSESGVKSIDWTVRRQGAPLPAIVLQVISDPRPQTHDGFDSIRSSRVQMDVIGDSRGAVVALREAGIAALVVAGTFEGIRFDRAQVASVRDLGRLEADIFRHRDSVDFIFWHKG